MLNLPYNFTYLSGIWQGLDYLKQAYPKGASEAAWSQDLLLLGMTLDHFEFLNELEKSQEIERSRLWIAMLTPLFTNREIKKVEYKNIQGCFPKLISEEVINELLESYLSSLPSILNKGENSTSASMLNKPNITFRINQREKERSQ